MMHIQRRNRQQPKTADAIDKQILALHCAMADKLLAHPALLAQAQQTLEQRYQAGQLRHSAYIHWYAILDSIDTPALFREELLRDDDRMRKLRRRTVLVGILTEQERQQVFANFSAPAD